LREPVEGEQPGLYREVRLGVSMAARRAPERLRVARRAPCEAPLGKRIRVEALLSILRAATGPKRCAVGR